MPRFKLSDESINDYGFRILNKGMDLKRFKSNPLMLWQHKRDNNWRENSILPIGKWENIEKTDSELFADPIFDETDELAIKIKSKVEQDILRMTSVGIRIIEVSEDPKLMLPGQTRPTVTKCELIECSIVDIGANKNAVRLYSEEMQTLSIGDATNLSLINNQIETNMKIKLSEFPLIGKLFAKNESEEVEVTSEQLASVEGSLAEMQNKLNTSEETVTTLTTEKETAVNKVTELETSNANLTANLETANNEIATLKEQLKATPTTVDKVEDPALEDEKVVKTPNELAAEANAKALINENE